MNTPPKVLLADDDADDRKLFIEAVRDVDSSIECFTANVGQEAMEFLKDDGHDLPDFIFLDLGTPRINGQKCLEEIKNDVRLKNIPVIIYSASNDVDDAKTLMDMGANHFITKPANPDEVYYLVAQVLSETWPNKN